MEKSTLSQDDFLDVLELSFKLKESFDEIVKDNDDIIGFNAFLTTLVNIILDKCESINDINTFKLMFMRIFNDISLSIQKDMKKNIDSNI